MTANTLWDALHTPTGLFVACMFLIFGVLLPLLIWDEAVKARQLCDDLLDADQRATDQTRAEGDAIVGRERWSA